MALEETTLARRTVIKEGSSRPRFAPKIDRVICRARDKSGSSRQWHGTAALMAAILLAISAAFILVALPTNTAAETHNPIYIWGDEDFEDDIWTSGVRSGSGVEGDPYIISDWVIVVTADHGVAVRDTDAHFVIRNVTVSLADNMPFTLNGIHLWNANNGTVENCTLTGWLWKGIYATGSNDVLISNNTVSIEPDTASDRCGIQVYSSPSVNITIDGNDITGANYGIMVWYADDVMIKNNLVSSGYYGGIGIQDAERATVWSNTMTGCGVTILAGSTPADSNSHQIPQNNTANGLPIHYVKDSVGIHYEGESVGQLIFASCVDLTVSDMYFSDCDVGIQVYHCDGVSLSGVTVEDTLTHGVTVVFTMNFEITGSTISGCRNSGLKLMSGIGFTVEGCTIESNLQNGMYIASSQQVNVTNCDISYNDQDGISYRVYNVGIDLKSFITYNEFRDNGVGVSLAGCKGVTIHHNDFIDNAIQALDSEIDFNQWDDGAEGNYWSDYSGDDDNPQDGIGDTPYDIDGNTFDNYPLIDFQVIPEFGHVAIPVIAILGLFAVLHWKRKQQD